MASLVNSIKEELIATLHFMISALSRCQNKDTTRKENYTSISLKNKSSTKY